MKRLRGAQANQAGFASIVIAIVLVLVLSLATVGFAQLMQREQRNALDRQLSSQAYYAAETGINDAKLAINNGFTSIKTSCGAYSETSTDPNLKPSNIADSDSKKAAEKYLVNNNIKSSIADTAASYPCLLINPQPEQLEYKLTVNEPRATQMTGISSDPASPWINSIIFNWEDPSGGDEFAPAAWVSGGHRFENVANWGSRTGVVKITLTPLTTGGINREKLTNETYTAFLYPNQASGPSSPTTYSYGSGVGRDGGVILNGNCHKDNKPSRSKRSCAVRIGNLSASSYLVTMSSAYQDVNLTVEARDGGNNVMKIKDAQTVIDSTGRAQDVLRRIRVHIPTHNDYSPPAGTEASHSICKQLQLTPDSGTSDSPDVCPIP